MKYMNEHLMKFSTDTDRRVRGHRGPNTLRLRKQAFCEIKQNKSVIKLINKPNCERVSDATRPWCLRMIKSEIRALGQTRRVCRKPVRQAAVKLSAKKQA